MELHGDDERERRDREVGRELARQRDGGERPADDGQGGEHEHLPRQHHQRVPVRGRRHQGERPDDDGEPGPEQVPSEEALDDDEPDEGHQQPGQGGVGATGLDDGTEPLARRHYDR